MDIPNQKLYRNEREKISKEKKKWENREDSRFPVITNTMPYGSWRFNVAFTRALQ